MFGILLADWQVLGALHALVLGAIVPGALVHQTDPIPLDVATRELLKIHLTRGHRWHGVVVDPQDQPVAGLHAGFQRW